MNLFSDRVPRWAAEHPVRYAFVAALGISFWLWVLGFSAAVALAAGPIVGALAWLWWRDGGPGVGFNEHLHRRFSRKQAR